MGGKEEASFWITIRAKTAISPLAVRKALIGVTVCSLQTKDSICFTIGLLHSESVSFVMSMSSIGDTPITVATANAKDVKGTISAAELGYSTDAEVKEELGPSIREIKRLPTRGSLMASGRFLLTFSCAQLPTEVTLNCGLRLSVRPHIPAPLRCRKCLQYGHHEDSCSRNPRCSKCGQAEHGDECNAVPRCAACNGTHAVTDPNCPVFQREMRIKRILITEGTSRAAAISTISPTKKSQTTDPPTAVSYASALSTAPAGAQITSPAPSNPCADLSLILAAAIEQTKLLTQIVEQNTQILKQNASILKLLERDTKTATPIVTGRELRPRNAQPTQSAKPPGTPSATVADPPSPHENSENRQQ